MYTQISVSLRGKYFSNSIKAIEDICYSAKLCAFRKKLSSFGCKYTWIAKIIKITIIEIYLWNIFNTDKALVVVLVDYGPIEHAKKNLQIKLKTK